MKPLKVFVIQPFRAKHSRHFYQWVKEVCDGSDGQFEAFRADDAQDKAQGPILQHRIDSYIKGTDICVADLMVSRNENALLEVGAAYALQIPVIPVSNEKLPADIGGILYVNLKPDSFDKDEVKEEFQEDLAGRLQEATWQLEHVLAQHFIAYGHANRKDVDFYSLVSRVEARIWVLTTNVDFFVNQKLKLLPTSKGKSILQMVAAMLDEKPVDFNIRVLTLDPDSNYTNDRALALHEDRREFREGLRQDLDMLVQFVNSPDCTRSVQVKIYEALPLQMTLFFDNHLISSIVTEGRSSRECVTYQHSIAVPGAVESYERHFIRLWNGATLIAASKKEKERIPAWKDEM
ncbi:MAG: hypothetical protein GY719_36780 [bacterium]|nr:hypothetical protein [bacterium]